MTSKIRYLNRPRDERVERFTQEHEWCVRIATDADVNNIGPRLGDMSRWLNANVNTWQATSVYDGTMDMEIYISTARQAQLFALRWSEHVVSSESTS